MSSYSSSNSGDAHPNYNEEENKNDGHPYNDSNSDIDDRSCPLSYNSEIIGQTHHMQIQELKGSDTDISAICGFCGKKDHLAYECALKKKCYICDTSMQHPTRKCPNKEKGCHHCKFSSHPKERCFDKPIQSAEIEQVTCIDCMKKGHISCKQFAHNTITWGTEPKDIQSLNAVKPVEIKLDDEDEFMLKPHSTAPTIGDFFKEEGRMKMASIYNVDDSKRFCCACGDILSTCKCN